MGNRLSLKNFELKNQTQSLFITGEQLSILDETMLLHLLVFAKKYKSRKFQTSRYRLCKMTGVAYAKANRDAIWRSIERLSRAHLIYETRQSGHKPNKLKLNGLLTLARFKSDGQISLAIHPYFFAEYEKGQVVEIDLGHRAKIKGDIAKALYRFIQGYKSRALQNSDTEKVPLFQLRDLCLGVNFKTKGVKKRILTIEKALDELLRNKHLTWQMFFSRYKLSF